MRNGVRVHAFAGTTLKLRRALHHTLNVHTAVRLISLSSSSRVTGTLYSVELLQPVLRQVAAAGIADQDRRAERRLPRQKRQRPLGRVALIEDVAGEHRVPAVAGVAGEQVVAEQASATSFACGVQLHRFQREGVDVGGGDVARAPAFIAAIATSPEPDARSSTRLPRTLSA